jgi:predicted signal transduction protein with EAL and GGDEF domain
MSTTCWVTAYGDQLLVAVARRLTEQNLRTDDMVARLGGDEFAVLLANSDAANAMAVAQRIAKAFELPLAFDDQTVDLSASIGIACWPLHAADADTLLSRAEVAMYAAKSKTTVMQLYDPRTRFLQQRRDAVAAVRAAPCGGPWGAAPVPAAQAGAVQRRGGGAEALVRWQHPQRGLVPPLEFIPFAEQTGFVRQLTLWMFEEAARLWASLQTGAMPVRMRSTCRRATCWIWSFRPG